MSNPNQRLILIIGSIVIIAAGAILILSAVPGGSPTASVPPSALQNATPQNIAPQAVAPVPTKTRFPTSCG